MYIYSKTWPKKVSLHSWPIRPLVSHSQDEELATTLHPHSQVPAPAIGTNPVVVEPPN